MNRALLPRMLVVVGVAFAVVALVVPAGHAATATDSGWWSRDAGLTIGRPSPPPEGALRVSRDPGGTAAVAAVRFQLDTTETRPVLVLRVTGSPADDTSTILACPAVGPWTGAAGAPIEEAPEADCDADVAAGRVSPDGTTITFDLSRSVAAGQAVDVVLVPGNEAGDPVTGTFTVDIAEPVSGDLQTQQAEGASSPPPVPPPPAASPPATSPPATVAPSPPPAVTAPPTTTFRPADLGTDPTPTTVAPVAPAPVAGPIPTEQAVSVPDELGGQRSRAFALVIAAGLVALGLWWRSQQEAATADDDLGGLGRFVRPRDGDATPVT